MGRARRIEPWMILALELGFDPAKILQKVRALRYREACKFGFTTAVMEAVYGWTLDELAMSLLHAIQHGRCRGPRCGRVVFRDLVSGPQYLGSITGDILDPTSLPLFCLNFGWACEADNKGDRDTPIADRAARLVEHRLIDMSPIDMSLINMHESGTPSMFDDV